MPTGMPLLPVTMGRKLREWLIKLGGGTGRGAQKIICERTGLNQSQVSKLLAKGGSKDPGIGTFERIARHLDVPVWKLVFMVETGSLPPPPPPESTRQIKDYLL